MGNIHTHWPLQRSDLKSCCRRQSLFVIRIFATLLFSNPGCRKGCKNRAEERNPVPYLTSNPHHGIFIQAAIKVFLNLMHSAIIAFAAVDKEFLAFGIDRFKKNLLLFETVFKKIQWEGHSILRVKNDPISLFFFQQTRWVAVLWKWVKNDP